jgi:hypothetical protein
MSIWSVHSARTVRMKRSAIALHDENGQLSSLPAAWTAAVES